MVEFLHIARCEKRNRSNFLLRNAFNVYILRAFFHLKSFVNIQCFWHLKSLWMSSRSDIVQIFSCLILFGHLSQNMCLKIFKTIYYIKYLCVLNSKCANTLMSMTYLDQLVWIVFMNNIYLKTFKINWDKKLYMTICHYSKRLRVLTVFLNDFCAKMC